MSVEPMKMKVLVKKLNKKQVNESLTKIDTKLAKVEELIKEMIKQDTEKKEKEKRVSELGGKIHDIAVPAGRGKPEIHPVFENIMKMRGEMIGIEGLKKRAVQLKAEENKLLEMSYDDAKKRLIELTSEKDLINESLPALDSSEVEDMILTKTASSLSWLRMTNKITKQFKEEVKAKAKEKVEEQLKEKKDEVVSVLVEIFNDMDYMLEHKNEYEIETAWADSIDNEKNEDKVLDSDPDIINGDDEEGEYGVKYRSYIRLVHTFKIAPFELFYRHTTEEKTYTKDDEDNWNFEEAEPEEDIFYDDDRGYYLERKNEIYQK